jgi:hypothetical protein
MPDFTHIPPPRQSARPGQGRAYFPALGSSFWFLILILLSILILLLTEPGPLQNALGKGLKIHPPGAILAA